MKVVLCGVWDWLRACLIALLIAGGIAVAVGAAVGALDAVRAVVGIFY